MRKKLNLMATLSYVVGGFSIFWLFYSICNGVGNAMILNNPGNYPTWMGTPPPADELRIQAMVGIATGVCFAFGSIAGAVMNFLAAGKWRKGEGKTFLMATCILNLVPCLATCCLAGIPIGIYGLVTLNDPQVKAFFAADPDERRRMAGDDDPEGADDRA